MKSLNDLIYVREKLRLKVIPKLQRKMKSTDDVCTVHLKIALAKQKLDVINWMIDDERSYDSILK